MGRDRNRRCYKAITSRVSNPADPDTPTPDPPHTHQVSDPNLVAVHRLYTVCHFTYPPPWAVGHEPYQTWLPFGEMGCIKTTPPCSYR
jgi:hypothetical protein